MKTIKNILRILPVSVMIVTFDIITWRHICDYKGDMGPDFYGFPFIYRTEIPWVNSMTGDFYILGFLFNVVIISILLGFGVTLLQRLIKITMAKKYKMTIWIVICFFCTSMTILNHQIIDWKYSWTHDFHRYFENPSLTCPKKITIFGWNE